MEMKGIIEHSILRQDAEIYRGRAEIRSSRGKKKCRRGTRRDNDKRVKLPAGVAARADGGRQSVGAEVHQGATG